MDASLLAAAKSIHYFFKYAVYISYLFLFFFPLQFHSDSFVRSLLEVFLLFSLFALFFFTFSP